MKPTFNLGTFTDPSRAIIRGQEPFFLTLKELGTHFLVSGSTGSGKSRTAIAMALQAWHQNVGMAVIDTHGETVNAIASHIAKYVAETGDLSPLDRVDYLQWTPMYCPRMDQLSFQPPSNVHPEFHRNFEVAARAALVDRMAIHIQGSTQGTDSFDATPRLRRMLKSALMACAVSAPHCRLPAALSYVLLNVSHPRHFEVYERIRPYLPRAIQGYFDLLHDLDNPFKALEQCESAINRLDAFFSELLTESFGETSDTAPVVDFQRIVRGRRLLLVNLQESPYFSHLQGVTIGRMIASMVIDTIICLRRDHRPDGYIVLLEEAGELLHEPFLRYLGAVRKYGVIAGICGQDLSTFGALVPKILSQIGVLVTYNQRFPDDAKLLSARCFQTSLDFAPLISEVEVEGDMEWIQIEDTSEQESTSASETTTTGTTSGATEGTSESTSKATQRGWQQSVSSQKAIADGHSTGASRTASDNVGRHESPVMAGKDIDRMLNLLSASTANGHGNSEQDSTTTTRSHAEQQGTSGSETTTNQFGRSRSTNSGASESTARGATKSSGKGKSKRWVHIPHKKREQRETGQLKAGPTNEQLMRFQQIIMGLPERTAIVNVLTRKPVILHSLDMPDAFASVEANVKAVEWLKQQMLRIRPYIVVPNLDPKIEDERIERFLRQLPVDPNLVKTAVDALRADENPFGI